MIETLDIRIPLHREYFARQLKVKEVCRYCGLKVVYICPGQEVPASTVCIHYNNYDKVWEISGTYPPLEGYKVDENYQNMLDEAFGSVIGWDPATGGTS